MVLGLIQFGLLILGGIVVGQKLKPLRNTTVTERLRRDLLLNYDRFARPTQHFDTTTVKFGVAVHYIDVIELTSSFTIICHARLMWTDDKLQWNTSDYENISAIQVADHEIWRPDIILYNSAASQTLGNNINAQPIVYNNGEVLWVPPEQFTVFCNINLRYWPFDQQKCYFKFRSHGYHNNQLNLTKFSEDVDAKTVFSNKWELFETTVEHNLMYYPFHSEPYSDITINITVTRISASYKAIVITPAFSVIFLILMTFWLPPQAGEKITLQGCTAVIICMFLLYFAEKLPAMSSNTPLLVLFYSSSLYMVCFSLMGSIAVIWLSRTLHTFNLPWQLKQSLTGWLGKKLWLGHYIAQTNINVHYVTTEEFKIHQGNSDMAESRIIHRNARQASTNDWVLLAAAIDRLSFGAYLVLFTFMAIGYSL